jgi:hypothetical protein
VPALTEDDDNSRIHKKYYELKAKYELLMGKIPLSCNYNIKPIHSTRIYFNYNLQKSMWQSKLTWISAKKSMTYALDKTTRKSSFYQILMSGLEGRI